MNSAPSASNGAGSNESKVTFHNWNHEIKQIHEVDLVSGKVGQSNDLKLTRATDGSGAIVSFVGCDENFPQGYKAEVNLEPGDYFESGAWMGEVDCGKPPPSERLAGGNLSSHRVSIQDGSKKHTLYLSATNDEWVGQSASEEYPCPEGNISLQGTKSGVHISSKEEFEGPRRVHHINRALLPGQSTTVLGKIISLADQTAVSAKAYTVSITHNSNQLKPTTQFGLVVGGESRNYHGVVFDATEEGVETVYPHGQPAKAGISRITESEPWNYEGFGTTLPFTASITEDRSLATGSQR